MSTFLRAIRAGAIHVRHGAILLAHYGRLGPSFDLCTKVIVEILREAGMFNDDGDLVVLVVTQALQEVVTHHDFVLATMTYSSSLGFYAHLGLCCARRDQRRSTCETTSVLFCCSRGSAFYRPPT